MTVRGGLLVLSTWLRPIIVLMIVIGLVEMMMPRGTVRRYVELFLGLLVLATILNPILALSGGDILWQGLALDDQSLWGEGQQPVIAQGQQATASLARAVFVERLEREIARLAQTVPTVIAAQAAVELAASEPAGTPGVATTATPAVATKTTPAVATVQLWLWLGDEGPARDVPTPSATPSAEPSATPSATPSGEPSATPSAIPPEEPAAAPSAALSPFPPITPPNSLWPGGKINLVIPPIKPVALIGVDGNDGIDPAAGIPGGGPAADDLGGVRDGGQGSGGPGGASLSEQGDIAPGGAPLSDQGDIAPGGEGWLAGVPGPVGDTLLGLLQQHFNLRRDQVILFWRPASGDGKEAW